MTSFKTKLFFLKAFLLLTTVLVISCKENTKKNVSKVNNQKQDINTDNNELFLNEDCIVFVSPSEEKIKELKKTNGEDFYTIADDQNFYMDNAMQILDSKKIKHLNCKENQNIKFKNKENSTTIIKNNTDYQWYLILYSNSKKNYKIISAPEIKEELSFFTTNNIDDNSFSTEEDINKLYLKKYQLVKSINCDINKDNFSDKILVFNPKKIENTENATEIYDSPVVVLINNKNNQFKIYKNSNIIETSNFNCPSDGFQNLVVKDNFFTIEQNICSGWNFIDQYITFKFDSSTNNIILHRFNQTYTSRKKPDENIPDKNLSNKDFGNISFESFNTKDF